MLMKVRLELKEENETSENIIYLPINLAENTSSVANLDIKP